MIDKERAIQKSDLFQGISRDAIHDLAEKAREKAFAKGQELFAMGDKAEGIFIILEGWVKLYRLSKEGDEVVIHVFGPGETFAEAAVFNERQAYPVNAQAIENTVVLEIPRSFFVKKIEENSQFALQMLGAIASRQHYLVQQIEQVSARSAPQRIGAFLLRFCSRRAQGDDLIVTLPYDKSVISQRLSIKPETFSRALNKLEPHGVEAKGRTVIIHDPQSLAEYCDISWLQTPC